MTVRAYYGGEEGGKPPASGPRKKKEEESSWQFPKIDVSAGYSSIRGMGIPVPYGKEVAYEHGFTTGSIESLLDASKIIPVLGGYSDYFKGLYGILPPEFYDKIKIYGTNEANIKKSIQDFRDLVAISPDFSGKAQALKLIDGLLASGFANDAASILPQAKFKDGKGLYSFSKFAQSVWGEDVENLTAEIGASVAMQLWNRVKLHPYVSFGNSPQHPYISMQFSGYPVSGNFKETGVEAIAGGAFGGASILVGYMKNPGISVQYGQLKVMLPQELALAQIDWGPSWGWGGIKAGAGGALFTAHQMSVSLAEEGGGSGVLVTLPKIKGMPGTIGTFDFHASAYADFGKFASGEVAVRTTPSLGLNFITKDGVKTSAEPEKVEDIAKVTPVLHLVSSYVLQAMLRADIPVAGDAFLVASYAPKSGEYDIIARVQRAIGTVPLLGMPADISAKAGYNSKSGLRDLSAELGLDLDVAILNPKLFAGAGVKNDAGIYYAGIRVNY